MSDTIERTTEAMLAAHALCGRLIEDMPDGVVFTSWEIMPGYVGGQYSTEASLNGAKRALAMLANRFELIYSEDPKNGFVQVNASSMTGGVEVHLWAHVRVTRQAEDDQSAPEFPGAPGSRWRDADGDAWMLGDDGVMRMTHKPHDPGDVATHFGPMTRMGGA